MNRVLGVDLGSRRIGLAVSDRSGTLATPLGVLERSRERRTDHEAIVDAARAHGATRIVVGLPRSLSGATGPAAQAVTEEVDELRAVAGPELPVELHDERFTTVVASRRLRDAGRSRTSVDAAAAAEILQSYLDQPPRGRAAGSRAAR